MYKNILLCTHGSLGSQKAEEYVFKQMIPGFPGATISVLTIIDKDWAEMSTDDWLNTSTTRTQFKDYVDEQLGREIEADWQRIKETYPQAEQLKFYKIVGGIEETIVELAEKIDCDLIVVGPYYKKKKRLFSTKMKPGLADTLDSKKLHPILTCPLLIAS